MLCCFLSGWRPARRKACKVTQKFWHMQVFGVESLYCRENATKKASFRWLSVLYLGHNLGHSLGHPRILLALGVDCAFNLWDMFHILKFDTNHRKISCAVWGISSQNSNTFCCLVVRRTLLLFASALLLFSVYLVTFGLCLNTFCLCLVTFYRGLTLMGRGLTPFKMGLTLFFCVSVVSRSKG